MCPLSLKKIGELITDGALVVVIKALFEGKRLCFKGQSGGDQMDLSHIEDPFLDNAEGRGKLAGSVPRSLWSGGRGVLDGRRGNLSRPLC